MERTVRVEAGRVRGREVDGVVEFLGIPYARAPVGPLRWRPPQPPDPWDGVREATEPGPIAPQVRAAATTSLPGEPSFQSEDCLHLSIWTPGVDAGPRPVMVWLHGGRFVSGSAGSVLYRGDTLARGGDVVVVTVNYRLGALGFLAHPALAGADGTFGNWGLFDQIAALAWVRRHISSFGGDPANVTLFGESAGAMCAATLLAMPAANGLFHRVILQSGPPYVQSAARAAAAAEDLAAELGLASVERAAWERIPASDLVGALGAIAGRPARAGELPQPLLPVVDGRSLPGEPLDCLASGGAPALPAIIGTNRDEASYFELTERRPGEMTEEDLLRLLAHSAPGTDAGAVARAYRGVLERRCATVSARDVWVAAASDLVFRWPSLRLAAALTRRGVPAFSYLFTWESPAFGGILGACHGLELPFVFGTVANPAVAAFSGGGEEAAALSSDMQSAWTRFARSGSPSGGRPAAWPAWDPVRRATMVFGAERSVVDAPHDEELAVWESRWPLRGAGRDEPAQAR